MMEADGSKIRGIFCNVKYRLLSICAYKISLSKLGTIELQKFTKQNRGALLFFFIKGTRIHCTIYVLAVLNWLNK
jgi:hypothetical protein